MHASAITWGWNRSGTRRQRREVPSKLPWTMLSLSRQAMTILLSYIQMLPPSPQRIVTLTANMPPSSPKPTMSILPTLISSGINHFLTLTWPQPHQRPAALRPHRLLAPRTGVFRRSAIAGWSVIWQLLARLLFFHTLRIFYFILDFRCHMDSTVNTILTAQITVGTTICSLFVLKSMSCDLFTIITVQF